MYISQKIKNFVYNIKEANKNSFISDTNSELTENLIGVKRNDKVTKKIIMITIVGSKQMVSDEYEMSKFKETLIDTIDEIEKDKEYNDEVIIGFNFHSNG